jgi:hypothetical protein
MEIPRGEITKTVYFLVRLNLTSFDISVVWLSIKITTVIVHPLLKIKEEKFLEAIEILEQLSDRQPEALNCLKQAYVFYHSQYHNL